MTPVNAISIKQEQQSVAVGPGNAHCMYIRQVSLHRVVAAAAADAATVSEFAD